MPIDYYFATTMQTLEKLDLKPSYDPRWFIWTVVFLIVSGVSLAGYIIYTSNQDSNNSVFVPLVHTLNAAKKK